jgi:hypothetical protein
MVSVTCARFCWKSRFALSVHSFACFSAQVYDFPIRASEFLIRWRSFSHVSSFSWSTICCNKVREVWWHGRPALQSFTTNRTIFVAAMQVFCCVPNWEEHIRVLSGRQKGLVARSVGNKVALPSHNGWWSVECFTESWSLCAFSNIFVRVQNRTYVDVTFFTQNNLNINLLKFGIHFPEILLKYVQYCILTLSATEFIPVCVVCTVITFGSFDVLVCPQWLNTKASEVY